MSEKYIKSSEKGHKGIVFAVDSEYSELRDMYFPELPSYLFSLEKVFSQTRNITLLEELEAKILDDEENFNFNVNKFFECTNETSPFSLSDVKLEKMLNHPEIVHETSLECANVHNVLVTKELMKKVASEQLEKCLERLCNVGKFNNEENNFLNINANKERSDKDKLFISEKGNSIMKHYTNCEDSEQICHEISYYISELAASIYTEHLFSSYKESYTAISCWNDVVEEVSSSFLPYDDGREVMVSYPSFWQPRHKFFGVCNCGSNKQEELDHKTNYFSSLQLLHQRPEQLLQQSSRETRLLSLQNQNSILCLFNSNSKKIDKVESKNNVQSKSCSTNTCYNSPGVIPSSVNIDAFCRYVITYKESKNTKRLKLPKCDADAKMYESKTKARRKKEIIFQHVM